MPICHAEIDLYYEIHGQGQPLCLIAGIGQGIEGWQWLIPLLQVHYQVICFDNRGIGKSEQPIGPYSVEMLAADSMALFDHLQLSSMIVLGHSLGAAISLEIAQQQPQRIQHLCLLSALYPGPQTVMPSGRAMAVLSNREGEPLELMQRGVRIGTAADFETRDPALFAATVQMNLHRNQPPERYLDQTAAGLGYLQTDKLAKLPESLKALPVSLLYGVEDEVTQPENGELIKAQITQASLEMMPHCGHMLPIENPKGIVEWLRRETARSV